MAHDWSKLTAMTGGKEISVTGVRVKDADVVINGEFELPPLAKLSYEDQVFVAMFVKHHGSIKEMEQSFGVSYPTIKGRLNRIGEQLGFVDAKRVEQKEGVLEQLERGEISAKDAIERLKS
jgi:hypothetical protein